MFWFVSVEDELSMAVARRLLGNDCIVQQLGNQSGNAAMKKEISKYLTLAEKQFVFLLTDLDRTLCAPELLRDWLGDTQVPEKLLFRVAVREVEAWLLADLEGFRDYFGIRHGALHENVDEIEDPKRTLLQLSSTARAPYRSEIVRQSNGNKRQGLGYNAHLTNFVSRAWDLDTARQNSESLNRACLRIEEKKREYNA